MVWRAGLHLGFVGLPVGAHKRSGWNGRLWLDCVLVAIRSDPVLGDWSLSVADCLAVRIGFGLRDPCVPGSVRDPAPPDVAGRAAGGHGGRSGVPASPRLFWRLVFHDPRAEFKRNTSGVANGCGAPYVPAPGVSDRYADGWCVRAWQGIFKSTIACSENVGMGNWWWACGTAVDAHPSAQPRLQVGTHHLAGHGGQASGQPAG